MPLSVPAPCLHCHVDAYEVCQLCHTPMCPSDTSVVDPAFCIKCGPSPTDSCIGITSDPLLEDTGDEKITHEGRVIHPTGDFYKTVPAAIAEMSQYQLEAYIDSMKLLVKQAESTLDYRRIALGIANMEKDDREGIARRRLRGVKFVSSGSRTISAAAAMKRSAKDTPLKGVIENLKIIGIDSPAKLAELLKFMTSGAGKTKIPSVPGSSAAVPTPTVQVPVGTVRMPLEAPETSFAQTRTETPSASTEQDSPSEGQTSGEGQSTEGESEFDKILREEQANGTDEQVN